MRVGRTITYEGRSKNEQCCWIVLYILAAILTITWISVEYEKRNRFVAFKETAPMLRFLHTDSSSHNGNLNNEVIHLHSSKLQTRTTLQDSAFNVNFPNSVALHRVTEYCQWQEHTSETTKKRNDGSEYTERTYYYVKGWHKHQIVSLLFDQPAAHHNPLRDPIPAESQYVPAFKAGDYEVSSEFVKSLSEYSYAKTADFPANEAWKWLANSPAALAHGFKYIGQGYFYSPNVDSSLTIMAKLVGQLAEGTLLDYQIGDLFSTCNAGDIRIHFEVVPLPETVSIIGKIAPSTSASQIESSLVQVVPHVTSKGYSVALAMPGQLTSTEMFDKAISSQKWVTVAIRIGLAVIAIILAQNWALGLCIVATAHGLLWTVLWGVTMMNIGMCTVGILLAVIVQQQAIGNVRNVRQNLGKD